MQKSRKSINPGLGKAFTFHGGFNSKILAARREKEIPGSFIVIRDGRYYVLKPKKVRSANPSRRRTKGRMPTPRISRYSHLRVNRNPKGKTLIYGRVLKIFARKTSGPFKGQDFVHTFKAGAKMWGMPDGSIRIEHL
jgi:hypothetical protein